MILFINFFIKKSINFYYVFQFKFLLFFYLFIFSKLISGLSETIYFNRGMDGMGHYGFARIIFNSFVLGDYYEAFRGGVDSFYYMPC